MGKLVLENMAFYAYHGHFAEEQRIGGRFRVDMDIETDFSKAAATDDLNDAVDYSRIYELVKAEMEIPSKLLEHLARRIADTTCSFSEKITRVTVTVSKLNPAIGGNMESFKVIYSR
ncbi:MAG: dihydroneopterin aldolase [Bacteroidales bacterium]|nr:dihydroneopterin aldolase [Bacteroidales bacterium]